MTSENEQAVREWLASNTRSGVLYRLAEQALALLDAKDEEIRSLRDLTIEQDRAERSALSRAEQAERERDNLFREVMEARAKAIYLTDALEQAEAALADERKEHQAFREDVSEAIVELHTAFGLSDAHRPAKAAAWSKVGAFILPAKPAVDPLYECLKEVVEMGRYDTAEQTALLRAAIERAGGTISFEGEG